MSNAMRTSGIVACMVLAALAIAGLPNIYTIANLLGIRMAPDWYYLQAHLLENKSRM
ncbi:MAG: class IIc cyclic bacteriocin [Olsenella sp.]|nr:class IIc cyclic bacteriocin [Olsenella sp.]